MKAATTVLILLLAGGCAVMSQVSPPAPLLPAPDARQLAWHKLEYYAFIHFGPNTFTDREWGEGREDPNVFNPTALDCRQWAKVVKSAGMKGIILTAKHHDGFCLWPSKYSTHTVAQSSWQGGKGDILKELSAACRAEGLKFGLYLSPWDRNHPAYGTPEYNRVFAAMLREVLTNYGPVFEVWFDGANGEGPNGKKQVYDWELFTRTVREYQPNAVIFSDAGDVRWVGNENGIAGETNWSPLLKARFVPGTPLHAQLAEGHKDGTHWAPTECDVSIRPGWFYHSSQDGQVKTPERLEGIFNASVGRNGSLLLNLPPDRRGLIHENDIASLMRLRAILDATYKVDLAKSARATSDTWRGRNARFAASKAVDGRAATYWATDDGQTTGTITLDFGREIRFDRVMLQEFIALGQRVEAFYIEAKTKSEWVRIANGTTIGAKRILALRPVTASALRLTIAAARACPTISTIGVFASPKATKGSMNDDWIFDETAEAKAKRMAWFREARFGMFIHWGLYAIPGGVWNGRNYGGASEWLLNTARIKVADYEPLLEQFNPVKYDPKRWVQIAKDAGLKYIVITSKHHEGFALWDTKQSDWSVMRTPYGRDLLKPLAEACKEAGIRLCFYHSIMDWHHPDYLPRREWDPRPEQKADYDRYVSFMRAQLKELLTGYGDLGILWFDGEWENTWTHDRGRDLYGFVRGLQPNIIVNNRVDTGREGMAGMSADEHFGDYGTPEQEIPASGKPGVDWESCMTMNNSWGFHKNDHDWKSSTTLIRNLIDCASKGGNYLLNVGPTPEGEIPEASVERLAAVGKWLRANGEAIYGTSAGPFPKSPQWGRATRRGSKLYLHVFDQTVGELELAGLTADIVKVYPLALPAQSLPFRHERGKVIVSLSGSRDETATVYVMEVRGEPSATLPAIAQSADGSFALSAMDAIVRGGTARYEPDKRAIGYWMNAADVVAWEVEVSRPGEFEVEIEFACDPGSYGSVYEIAIGGNRIRGTIEATGGWSDFATKRVGTLTASTAGRATLTVTPIEKPREAVMNLRTVKLTPKR